MKVNLNTKYLILAFMAILLWSCEDDEDSSKLDVEKQIPIEFQNLGLQHQYSTPEKALSYNINDLQSIYFDESEFLSSNIQYPNLNAMALVLENNISKYPNVYRMNSSDYEMIKMSFPNLSDQQIEENIEVINKYYNMNLQYDLLMGIIDLNSVQNKSALNDDTIPEGLYPAEFWYLLTKPRATASIRDATLDAQEWTVEFYGENGSLDKSDAFRHIAWNTMICKYHGEKTRNIEDAVQLALEFTNIHEEENQDIDGSPAYDNAMDYHNNWIGRDYFESIATISSEDRAIFGQKKYLDCPNNDIIKSTIKQKLDNAIMLNQTVDAVEAVDVYTPVYFVD